MNAADARRKRDKESADPLSNNDTLIRAVETALQLLAIKRYANLNRSNSFLQDTDYLRKFIPLALDPHVTRLEMAQRLGLHRNTIDAHMRMFTGYLEEFNREAYNLRDSRVGFSWADSRDLEENGELIPTE